MLDDAGLMRAAVDIVAEGHRQRPALMRDNIALDGSEHAVEQVEAPMHVADDIKPRVIVGGGHGRLALERETPARRRRSVAGRRLHGAFTAPGQLPPEPKRNPHQRIEEHEWSGQRQADRIARPDQHLPHLSGEEPRTAAEPERIDDVAKRPGRVPARRAGGIVAALASLRDRSKTRDAGIGRVRGTQVVRQLAVLMPIALYMRLTGAKSG